MNHGMMLLVLCRLCELKRATSREVADSLGLGSVKYVSLVLSRCKRRGFVDREPYRCGREHGFVYWLTDNGAKWILKKAESKNVASDLSSPQVISKNEMESKHESVAPVTSPALMIGSDSKTLKRLNLVFGSLQLENEALERKNQELSGWFGIASTTYFKCSSERDFIYWKSLSLENQFERKEKEVQLLVMLLEEKDEFIRDLLRRIFELERRSNLPERGFSSRSLEQVKFRYSAVVKKLPIQQPRKAEGMSVSEIRFQLIVEKLAFLSWLTAMDRWSDWLPQPKGGGYTGDIFWSVTKAYYDELKSIEKPGKISKSYGREYEVPMEILRLPC